MISLPEILISTNSWCGMWYLHFWHRHCKPIPLFCASLDNAHFIFSILTLQHCSAWLIIHLLVPYIWKARISALRKPFWIKKWNNSELCTVRVKAILLFFYWLCSVIYKIGGLRETFWVWTSKPVLHCITAPIAGGQELNRQSLHFLST